MTKDELILLFSLFTFLQCGGCKIEQKKVGLGFQAFKKCAAWLSDLLRDVRLPEIVGVSLFCAPVSQGYREMVPS